MKNWFLMAGLAGTACAVQAAVPDRPPNIVILLADDLGYADIGIHGATDVQTPHIDSLFREGIQFPEAYVSYSACGPSRASIMTGRQNHRIGFPKNPDHVVPNHPGNLLGLPQGTVTVADLLKQQGYATAIFGKWHLGLDLENHPLNHGFDEFYGFLGSLYSYFDGGTMQPPFCMMRGFEKVHEKEYLTDAFARESADFIERHKNKPFFLIASFNAPHTPLMYDTPPPPGKAIPLDGTDDLAENRRMLVNMIQGLDRGVGAVMDKLAAEGLLKNTLVFFLSDNGGPEATGVYSNGKLRGWKAQQFEGGIRVPMAAYWKGTVRPGISYPHPILAIDMVATALNLSGGSTQAHPELDGRDLTAILRGRQTEPLHADEALCWDGHGMQAVRRGDWKLVMRGGKPFGLFNIPADAGEQNNLIAAYPERAGRLLRDYQKWHNALPEPAYHWVGPKKLPNWDRDHIKKWKVDREKLKDSEDRKSGF